MELENKIILVTGAKGGLGTFVTNALLRAGARVVGVSRSIARSDFPDEHFSAMPAELSTCESAQTLLDAVIEEHGRIDGLAHLVGGFAGGQSVADTDDSILDRMLDLNVRSAFYTIRAALPRMRAQGAGRIVAIGSRAAAEPSPMAGVYAASKAALVSLVRTAARENADRGVSANVVLPGTMDTAANRAAELLKNTRADFSRWVQPCQVANLVVYLMSDRASQVNGAVIPVYGQEA